MNNKEKDFFVGWQEGSPPSSVKSTRIFVWTTLLIALLIPIVFVVSQSSFSEGIFQYGQLTRLKGNIIYSPTTLLHISKEEAQKNNLPSQNILLFGYGKFGPQHTLDEIEKENQINILHMDVEIEGTLIQDDGKVGLELTNGSKSIVSMSQGTTLDIKDAIPFGRKTIRGEIIDSKCALGVMKPGFGKIHRSCAIRCIEGGVQPLFREQLAQDSFEYYIISMHDALSGIDGLIPHIADQLSICGEVSSWEDWKILSFDPSIDISRSGSPEPCP